MTLRGEGIAQEFKQIVEDYVVRRFGGAQTAAEALHLDDAAVEFDVAGSPRQPTGTFSMVAGDVGIDGRVVTGLNYVEKMVELSSGCICCSIDE